MTNEGYYEVGDSRILRDRRADSSIVLVGVPAARFWHSRTNH